MKKHKPTAPGRGYPPRLPGLGACRSIVLDMAAGSLAQSIETAGFVPGGHPSAWREAASSGDAATLLLQPMNDTALQDTLDPAIANDWFAVGAGSDAIASGPALRRRLLEREIVVRGDASGALFARTTTAPSAPCVARDHCGFIFVCLGDAPKPPQRPRASSSRSPTSAGWPKGWRASHCVHRRAARCLR